MTIVATGLLQPVLGDVRLYSPSAHKQIQIFSSKIKKSPSAPVNRTIYESMETQEKEKIQQYNAFAHRVYHEHLPNLSSFNVLGQLGVNFVPLVMTIYGNIGHAFQQLLLDFAQLPGRAHDPSLHPTRNALLLTPDLSEQATLGRYKSLFAAALARAIAHTVSHTLLRKRTELTRFAFFSSSV